MTLRWDANADAVVGYYVYIGPSPGSYSQRIDVGNVTHYDLNAESGRRYCLAVSAYAAGPMEGQRSNEVCTTNGSSNTAPTLSNPGTQSVPVAQPFNLWLSAVDPEGATLTYTLTGLPSGLTVAANSGMITGTPTQTGSSTVNATVSDGELSASVSFTMNVTGSAPGAATLLRPTGTLTSTSPTFEWSPVATATRYRLWVDDAGPNQQLLRDLTPAEAGCAQVIAGAVCRSTPGFTLVSGAASWSVRATNSYGDGPWSGSMDFTLPGGQAPTVSIALPTSAANFLTSSATVAVSGTASDDVGVTQVTWASDKGVSGTASGTSTWSVPSIALQPGANVITITARDASNNTATDVVTVTLSDSQAPTVSVITQPSALAPTSSSIVVTGTAADNVGVTEVRWANSLGGSGVATGTTSWSTGAIALRTGTNVITITARDSAGNTGTGVLTLSSSDAQAPTIDIAQPTTSSTFATSNPTLLLAGAATDNVAVTEVRWANSQGGSGVATGGASWSAGTIALKHGSNVITVTARDAAGNSTTDSLAVTVTDSVAPTVAITRPSSLSTPATTASLSGTATDAFGVVQVAWSNSRGGSGVAAGTASWSVAGIPLQAGSNIITITARDSAGLIGSDVVTVSRTDSDAPTVSFLTPSASGSFATTARTLALTGTSADAGGVSQVTWASSRGGSGTATGTTSWAVQGVALQLGTNVITVTARDAAGNAGQAVLSVNVTDGEVPTVSFVSPVAAPTFVTTLPTVALAGTSADAGGIAAVTWSNSQGGSGTATGTTSWSVPLVALVPGVNVITVVARDTAGNSGRAQLSITVTDDRAPIVAVVSNAPSGPSLIQVVGTASDNFGVATVSWRTSSGANGLATGTTNWTVASIPVTQGQNDITITATDRAGNATSSVIRVNGNNARRFQASTTTTTTTTSTTPTTGTTSGTTAPTTTTTSTTSGTTAATTTTTSTTSGTTTAGTAALVSTTTGTATGTTSSEPRPPYVVIFPTVINGPWVTSAGTVPLKGTASDNVTRVTWSIGWGGSGTASGTQAWTIPTIGLQIGPNVITVTATTADGRVARQTVTVTYRPRGNTR